LSHDLAVLFAQRLIQRRDVKAVQLPKVYEQIGAYVPDRKLKSLGQHAPLGFTMDHLYAHLEGRATYGHYVTDQDNKARMFCLDIDLNRTGWYVPMEQDTAEGWSENWPPAIELRDPTLPEGAKDMTMLNAWHDRAHPARPWLKMQMGMLARKFTQIIQEDLEIGCAAAYSGNKGIHVYGFTGEADAADVRRAIEYVLNKSGEWAPIKGQHFWGHRVESPYLGYKNFTVETYPKQASMEDKDLGNLLRLPLGVNLKHNDPTFFLDLRTAPGVMQPHPDPVQLLTTGNPYA
jgi:hypothetical protein